MHVYMLGATLLSIMYQRSTGQSVKTERKQKACIAANYISTVDQHGFGVRSHSSTSSQKLRTRVLAGPLPSSHPLTHPLPLQINTNYHLRCFFQCNQCSSTASSLCNVLTLTMVGRSLWVIPKHFRQTTQMYSEDLRQGRQHFMGGYVVTNVSQ